MIMLWNKIINYKILIGGVARIENDTKIRG